MLVFFILLWSSMRITADGFPCCFVHADDGKGSTYCSKEDFLTRSNCERLLTRIFTSYANRGFQTTYFTYLKGDYYFTFLGSVGNYSDTFSVISIYNDSLSSWSFNKIANETYLIAIFLREGSSIDIDNQNDCIFLRNVINLQFFSMKNSNTMNEFILLCKYYFSSVAELGIQNMSRPYVQMNLQEYFPNLQILDLSMSNFTIIPQFPWNNFTIKLPLNFTRQSYLQRMTYFSKSVLQNPLDIQPRVYKRIYRLDYNPNIDLTSYRFKGFLHVISLVGCQLTHLNDNIFQDVTGLQFLDLARNKLQSLPESVLMTLRNLRSLNITYNMLTHLPTSLFENQTHLVVLRLSHNRLEQLENGLFVKLVNLEYLHLDNNNIKYVNKDAFAATIDTLKFISFENNPILDFPYSLIYSSRLDIIDLRGHSISSINFNEFFSDNSINYKIFKMNLLQPYRTVDMSRGGTRTLSITRDTPPWKLLSILTYQRFILDFNPLECYCDIALLLKYATALKDSNKITGNEHAFTNWRCSVPYNLKGELLLNLNQTQLYCPLIPCPSRCKCYKRYKTNTNIVDCLNSNLTEPPSVLPQGENELLLAGNKISHFTMDKNQCAGIVELQIQDNSLQSMDPNCISSMIDLKVLLVNKNLITSLPKEIQQLKSLSKVQLGNNPYQCDCKSLWFKHWLLGKKAILKDYNEIKCANIGEDTGHTIYNVPDNDFICIEDHFNTVTNIIASVTTLAVLILLCMLLFYINWQRFKVCLYIYTGWHPFDKAGDDDLMPYDALVAYISEDDWVKTNIITPLAAKYKLMDCKKDFKFGVDQNKSILEGISKSKRLLLVITPDSLNERLMRHTIDNAIEKCKTVKSNFIIPVFHNCSPKKCEDKHLKRFVKNRMFVHTQQHDFLCQIRYYFPKEKLKPVYYKRDNGNIFEDHFPSLDQMQRRSLDNLEVDTDAVAFNADHLSFNAAFADGPYMSCPELVIDRPSPEGSVVFVWYAYVDFQFMMNEIVRPLEEYGHTFILADKSFIPGASNQENILNAIKRSNRTIIILSKESIVDELLLFTFRDASERHMSDDHYMMGLIVRGDVEELDCDEEVKKHLFRYTPLFDSDGSFSGKLRAFVKQYNVSISQM